MDIAKNEKGMKNYPRALRKSQSAEIAENLRSLRLRRGEEESFAVFDMGEESVGGYPVFTVKSYGGNPRLRISYSDRYGTMETIESMRKGDFIRGCCKYLGVELPVMPANPGRFEEYAITRKGVYLFPLIQGQERFVAIEAEGENCEVEIEDFYIYNPVPAPERSGSFECSDARLNSLFKACADTLDLATIRAETIGSVGGTALLRGLTQGENGVIRREYCTLTDYVYEVRFGISYNPHASSGICLYFRAPDRKNGYVLSVDLDGTVTAYIRKDSVERFLVRRYIHPLTDNVLYDLRVECKGNSFQARLGGEEILSFRDDTFASGSFGFCQMCEKWAFAKRVRVWSGESLLLDEDFSDLSGYKMVRTPPFISDGAKRDRLPWSGDIDWAFRSGFYSHGAKTAMPETLELFAKHQTPEGYVFGTFYPEYEDGYRSREYGHYESDMFSAWYIVALGTYYRYTADVALAKKLYPSVRAGLGYFLRSIEADGLFNQRYETSKGLWDHQLGDFGKNSYTNLIIWECFRTGEMLAELLGEREDAALYASTSQRMKEGIFRLLWSDRCGGFIKTLGNEVYCDMANAFAMGKGLVTKDQAEKISKSALGNTKGYGKILSLMIHGLYSYGYDELAFEMLTTPQPFRFDNGEVYAHVSWLDMVDSQDYPHTTMECMHFPPAPSGNNTDWGDLSHPDSGVNDILGGDILGLRPLEAGFKTFAAAPHVYGVTGASGKIETRFGEISLHWELVGGAVKGKVVCPKACTCVVPDGMQLEVEYR